MKLNEETDSQTHIIGKTELIILVQISDRRIYRKNRGYSIAIAEETTRDYQVFESLAFPLTNQPKFTLLITLFSII